LRRRLEYATEPLAAEIAKLRPRLELLQRRNEALGELLECAARGGHKDAQEIMEVIRGYDLTLTPQKG
jgi:hypothetical protein